MRKYDAVNGEQRYGGLCESNFSTPLLNIRDTTYQYSGILFGDLWFQSAKSYSSSLNFLICDRILKKNKILKIEEGKHEEICRFEW